MKTFCNQKKICRVLNNNYVNNCGNQIVDIFAKENELNNQREEVDMQVRKLERSGAGNSAEHELKVKE